MQRFLRLLLRPSVRERLLAPVGFDALVLATNLVTGVIVARALGPEGRGELTAILILTQLAGWVFSLGSTEGITFRLARHPEDGARLLGSWLAVSLPLAIAAVGVGELLLPTLFAAQTESALSLARIYLLTATLQIIHLVVTAILLGDQDFHFFNFTRGGRAGADWRRLRLPVADRWLFHRVSADRQCGSNGGGARHGGSPCRQATRCRGCGSSSASEDDLVRTAGAQRCAHRAHQHTH
jgi:hypothetical protein